MLRKTTFCSSKENDRDNNTSNSIECNSCDETTSFNQHDTSTSQQEISHCPTKVNKVLLLSMCKVPVFNNSFNL